MTHVDDLYEPGDDREPEPDERDERDEGGPYELDDLPRMLDALLAELREARQRLAEWEALPGREEFATTDQQTSTIPPNKHHPYRVTAGEALKASEKGRQGWVRRLTVHPWEPIDDKGPF